MKKHPSECHLSLTSLLNLINQILTSKCVNVTPLQVVGAQKRGTTMGTIKTTPKKSENGVKKSLENTKKTKQKELLQN